MRVDAPKFESLAVMRLPLKCIVRALDYSTDLPTLCDVVLLDLQDSTLRLTFKQRFHILPQYWDVVFIFLHLVMLSACFPLLSEVLSRFFMNMNCKHARGRVSSPDRGGSYFWVI